MRVSRTGNRGAQRKVGAPGLGGCGGSLRGWHGSTRLTLARLGTARTRGHEAPLWGTNQPRGTPEPQSIPESTPALSIGKLRHGALPRLRLMACPSSSPAPEGFCCPGGAAAPQGALQGDSSIHWGLGDTVETPAGSTPLSLAAEWPGTSWGRRVAGGCGLPLPLHAGRRFCNLASSRRQHKAGGRGKRLQETARQQVQVSDPPAGLVAPLGPALPRCMAGDTWICPYTQELPDEKWLGPLAV